MRLPVTLLALAGALAGCAGPTTQLVAFRTVPEGAVCTVARGGIVLGVVPTPGRLAVGFSDRSLDVTCLKPGWQPATETVKAVYTGAGFGRLLVAGPADVLRSTDFRYDPDGVVVELTAN